MIYKLQGQVRYFKLRIYFQLAKVNKIYLEATTIQGGIVIRLQVLDCQNDIIAGETYLP
jgi:hypothetical protein